MTEETHDPTDTILAWLFALIVCFSVGVYLGTMLARQRVVYAPLTHRAVRHLCSPEQRAVVSQWRIWTEQAAANGECRGYVRHGDEP